MVLPLDLRSASLVFDAAGRQQWRETVQTSSIDPTTTALLLCDVWNDHTSRGAVERLEAMIPAMADVVTALRAQGVTVVHCPSDCMDFYAKSPARRRVLETPSVEPPPEIEHDDPPTRKAPSRTRTSPCGKAQTTRLRTTGTADGTGRGRGSTPGSRSTRTRTGSLTKGTRSTPSCERAACRRSWSWACTPTCASCTARSGSSR